MSAIAIPNVSEGTRRGVVSALVESVERTGARVLDVHSDAVHNRSVLTVYAPPDVASAAMRSLASSCRELIDLSSHAGVHPRFGSLDVCPFVALDDDLTSVIQTAIGTAESLAEDGFAVYLYEAAHPGARSLPELRRALAAGAISPDLGPEIVDERTGVICVGARRTLIAFNVWLACDRTAAAVIASQIRQEGGGLAGVRALGLQIEEGRSQVSMNLIDPSSTGIDEVYDRVAEAAEEAGVEVIAAEIVGLVPERFLPKVEKEAARHLLAPGRSLESAIADL